MRVNSHANNSASRYGKISVDSYSGPNTFGVWSIDVVLFDEVMVDFEKANAQDARNLGRRENS
jgi:hypothetical protein